MRTLILILALLATAAHAETDAEIFCKATQEEARKVTQQLPIMMDPSTKWVGVSAVYVNDRCHVLHQYVMDSWVLVDMVWEHWKQREGVTREDVVAFYESEEGVKQAQQVVEDLIRRRIPDMLEIPGITFTADYTSEGPLDSFTVEIKTGSD